MRVCIDVSGCKDCPYRRRERDMGASWESCYHPDYRQMNSVADYLKEGFAPWCPLLKDADQHNL